MTIELRYYRNIPAQMERFSDLIGIHFTNEDDLRSELYLITTETVAKNIDKDVQEICHRVSVAVHTNMNKYRTEKPEILEEIKDNTSITYDFDKNIIIGYIKDILKLEEFNSRERKIFKKYYIDGISSYEKLSEDPEFDISGTRIKQILHNTERKIRKNLAIKYRISFNRNSYGYDEIMSDTYNSINDNRHVYQNIGCRRKEESKQETMKASSKLSKEQFAVLLKQKEEAKQKIVLLTTKDMITSSIKRVKHEYSVSIEKKKEFIIRVTNDYSVLSKSDDILDLLFQNALDEYEIKISDYYYNNTNK